MPRSMPSTGRALNAAPYLAVHGASSAWFRLKWIADVAALLAPLPQVEIERLYRSAAASGAGRAAALALLLCHRLFATPLDARLLAELRGDRIVRALLRLSLRKLAGRAEARELDATRLGTLTIHLLQLGLKKGLRGRLGMYLPPLLEALGLAEVEHNPRNNRMRAI